MSNLRKENDKAMLLRSPSSYSKVHAVTKLCKGRGNCTTNSSLLCVRELPDVNQEAGEIQLIYKSVLEGFFFFQSFFFLETMAVWGLAACDVHAQQLILALKE